MKGEDDSYKKNKNKPSYKKQWNSPLRVWVSVCLINLNYYATNLVEHWVSVKLVSLS